MEFPRMQTIIGRTLSFFVSGHVKEACRRSLKAQTQSLYNLLI